MASTRPTRQKETPSHFAHAQAINQFVQLGAYKHGLVHQTPSSLSSSSSIFLTLPQRTRVPLLHLLRRPCLPHLCHSGWPPFRFHFKRVRISVLLILILLLPLTLGCCLLLLLLPPHPLPPRLFPCCLLPRAPSLRLPSLSSLRLRLAAEVLTCTVARIPCMNRRKAHSRGVRGSLYHLPPRLLLHRGLLFPPFLSCSPRTRSLLGLLSQRLRNIMCWRSCGFVFTL